MKRHSSVKAYTAKLLLRVKKHILAEPNRLIMDTFCMVKSTDESVVIDTDAHRQISHPFAPCGTAACIGGWALILRGVKPKQVFESYSVYDDARRALRLGHDPAERLFVVDCWPDKFRLGYESAKMQRKLARITGERIDHFITTGE